MLYLYRITFGTCNVFKMRSIYVFVIGFAAFSLVCSVHKGCGLLFWLLTYFGK